MFIIVAISVAGFMAVLRAGLMNSFGEGAEFSYGGDSISIYNNALSFLARVGSSFDVLSLAVTQKHQFSPYVNITDEFIDVVNAYWPGGFIATNAPPWSQILYTIGHPAASLETMLAIRSGENITLPAHLYINFGLAGACLVSFLLMLFYTIAYRYSKTVVVRVFFLFSVVLDISNGSLIGMVIGYPFLYIWFYLVFLIYKLFFHPSQKQAACFAGEFRRA